MIALDTNVLVRFLTQDDAEQAQLASSLISGLTSDDPGFVCREVLVELVWVLERAYKYPRADIAGALAGLLAAPELVIEAADYVADAPHLYENKGYGFSDLMIRQAAKRSGSHRLVSFDKKAAQLDAVDWLAAPESD